MQIKKDDIKNLFSENDIQNKVKKIAEQINSDYRNEELYIVCVLKGSIMFTADLVKLLTMPVKMEFIRLSSYGSSTTSCGRVKAVDLSLPELNGKNVLVIEDIIDSGLTAKFLLDFINNSFATKSTKFCALLDKKCCRTTDIDAEYVGFEIDNKFVVGYGLDFDGDFRNLPFVGYIETDSDKY